MSTAKKENMLLAEFLYAYYEGVWQGDKKGGMLPYPEELTKSAEQRHALFEAVEHYLCGGAVENLPWPNSPMDAAVDYADAAMVEFLLQRGAIPCRLDDDGSKERYLEVLDAHALGESLNADADRNYLSAIHRTAVALAKCENTEFFGYCITVKPENRIVSFRQAEVRF